MKNIKTIVFLTLIFLININVCHAQSQFDAQIINNGSKTVFKAKIPERLIKNGSKILLFAKTKNENISPFMVFLRPISQRDLDKDGYFSHTLDFQLSAGYFQAFFEIKDSVGAKTMSTKSLLNCSGENVCHKIISMDQNGLIVDIQYPDISDASKVGLECRSEGGLIEEKFIESSDVAKTSSRVISFQKKVKISKYLCQPYVVAPGFLGFNAVYWGNEFDFIVYPSIQQKSFTFNKTSKDITISSLVEPGSQDYYYWLVVKQEKRGGDPAKTFCIPGKIASKTQKNLNFILNTTKKYQAYACGDNYYPVISSKQEFSFYLNMPYKMALMIRGQNDGVIAGKEKENFTDFSITGKAPTPHAPKIEKDMEMGFIKLSSYKEKDEVLMDQYFTIREYEGNVKYKIPKELFKIIGPDSSGEVLYFADLRIGINRLLNLKTSKMEDFYLYGNKKYQQGMCAENDFAKNCSESVDGFDTNGMQKSIYGGTPDFGEICTHESFTKEIPLEKAMKLAEKIGPVYGVRKQFLLAILIQETNLGRLMGDCLYVKGSNYCNIRSDKDLEIFKKLCYELGIDWTKTLVSCGGTGSGGAMGFAQIMPIEWSTRVNKVKSKSKHNPASPWNTCDAVIAAAINLRDRGARPDGSGERAAAISYNGWAWYGDKVVKRRDCIIKYWNNLAMIESNCR